MEKKVLVSLYLVLFIGCISADAQLKESYPLSDAIKYVEFLKQQKYAEAYSILKFYKVSAEQEIISIRKPADSTTIELAVLGKLKDTTTLDVTASLNSIVPSLEEFGITKKEFDETYQKTPLFISDGSNQNEAATGLGGYAIDAIATVVANRFKEELTIAFLEGLRDELREEEDLSKLFPNALNVLLNEDVFKVNLWLTTFRGGLDEDLRNLPSNVPDLIDILDKRIVRDPGGITTEDLAIIKSLYKSSFELLTNSQQSYIGVNNIFDAITTNIDTIISNSEQKLGWENAKHAFYISDLFLNELGNSAKNDWASRLALNKLLSDKNTLKAFLGFTIEKYKKELSERIIVIKGDENSAKEIDLYSFLNDNENIERVEAILNYVSSLSNKIIEIQTSINDLRSRGRNSKLVFNDYIPLIEKGFQGIQIIIDEEWLKTFNVESEQLSEFGEYVAKVETVFTFSKSLKEAIDDKQYSKVLVSLLDFIPEFFEQEDLDKSIFFAQFVKYTNLAISLSSAQSSEELVTVIESAALPVQSYRLKRNSGFSITLNAYAGGFYGVERLREDQVANKSSDLLGFTAPIGIGLNWALRTNKRKPGDIPSRINIKTEKNGDKVIKVEKELRYYSKHSFSFFVSIIDVGALAAFRLTDDQTPVDKIQFQNILAPGAHVMFGLWNTPLSVGLGIQYGPELREVTASEDALTPTIESSAWRYGASLTVDIPLLQIYRKNKLVKKKEKKALSEIN